MSVHSMHYKLTRGMLQKLPKLKRVCPRGDDCEGEVTSNILRLEGTLQNHESQTIILVGCQVEHPYFVLHFSSGIGAEPREERFHYTHSTCFQHFPHFLPPATSTSGSILVTKLAVDLTLASVVPC